MLPFTYRFNFAVLKRWTEKKEICALTNVGISASLHVERFQSGRAAAFGFFYSAVLLNAGANRTHSVSDSFCMNRFFWDEVANRKSAIFFHVFLVFFHRHPATIQNKNQSSTKKVREPHFDDPIPTWWTDEQKILLKSVWHFMNQTTTNREICF